MNNFNYKVKTRNNIIINNFLNYYVNEILVIK